jgi:hypothetical protein
MDDSDDDNIINITHKKLFNEVSSISRSMTTKVSNIDLVGDIKNLGKLDVIGGIKNVTNLGGDMMLGGFQDMTKKLQNMFNEDSQGDLQTNFGSASDYKSKYLSKYGVSLLIPSLYV